MRELLENVFETIKLWTFECGDVSSVLGAADHSSTTDLP